MHLHGQMFSPVNSLLTEVYRIRGLVGGDFNFGSLTYLMKIVNLTVRHYQAIYTASMGFFTYSTEIHQSKISPIVLFKQIAKYFIILCL